MLTFHYHHPLAGKAAKAFNWKKTLFHFCG